MKQLYKMISTVLMGLFTCSCASLDIKDHKASFLFDNAGTRVMNILAYNFDDNHFNNVVNKCKNNGDKVIYVYAGYNKGDGGGITSFYVNDKFGTVLDSNKMKIMKNRMDKLRQKDLWIVGWFFADDNTGSINFHDMQALKNYISVVVDNFDSYISEYVIGIEVDEYLNISQVDELSKHIKTLTKKPLGCHQVPNKFNYSTLGNINKHYHQYGFDKPTSYIESQTISIKNALGKPIIAAEYDKSSDSPQAKARGDAAIKGGAAGTGNGRN